MKGIWIMRESVKSSQREKLSTPWRFFKSSWIVNTWVMSIIETFKSERRLFIIFETPSNFYISNSVGWFWFCHAQCKKLIFSYFNTRLKKNSKIRCFYEEDKYIFYSEFRGHLFSFIRGAHFGTLQLNVRFILLRHFYLPKGIWWHPWSERKSRAVDWSTIQFWTLLARGHSI